MTTTQRNYIVSIRHLRQLEAERKLSDKSSAASPPSSLAGSYSVAGKDFYQQFTSLSSTRISLQYNYNEFVTFVVSDAAQGQIVPVDSEGIGLQCWIKHKTYIFRREHFDQMSKRECNELFSYLGVDGSQLI